MAIKFKGINLLPGLTRAEVVQEKRKGSLVLGTASITFLVSLISVGLLFYSLYQSYTIQGTNLPFLEIQGLDSQISSLNGQVEQYREVLSAQTELSTKVNFVNNILLGRPDYQATLARVQALLPEDIDIREYNIDEANQIQLTGYAKDYFNLAIFINRAQKPDLTEGYLSNFFLERATLRDDRVDFTISAVAVFPEESEVLL